MVGALAGLATALPAMLLFFALQPPVRSVRLNFLPLSLFLSLCRRYKTSALAITNFTTSPLIDFSHKNNWGLNEKSISFNAAAVQYILNIFQFSVFKPMISKFSVSSVRNCWA